MGKWSSQKNGFGKFDCPMPACEHKGRAGFSSAQGLGKHITFRHKGETIPAGNPAAPALDTLDPLGMQPVSDITQEDAAEFDRRVAMPPQRIAAAQVATAILNLPEVAGLSSDQLETLMQHVCAIKKIDEGNRDTHDTGFATDHLDRMAHRERLANGKRESSAEQRTREMAAAGA